MLERLGFQNKVSRGRQELVQRRAAHCLAIYTRLHTHTECVCVCQHSDGNGACTMDPSIC